MLILYDFGNSVCCQKVRITMRAKGLTWEPIKVDAGGLVISSNSFFFAHIEQLAALAAQNRVPAIFGFREFPAAGGLMSYGADLADQHRTIGGYVGRILKGEKPADLPVQQSIKVQLVVNLKAAKTLGIEVPQILQVAAEEVLE